MSVSSRRPSRVSDMDSHLTILQPRESVPSDIISVFGAVMQMDDKDIWNRKTKFYGRIVSFCLGPGNIWRFPKQMFLFGDVIATYLYLYILYWWLFGTALLVFQLGLGQYFGKGFAKIFSLCPLMEGITFSMFIYCLVAGMLYNMLNAYSFIYLFSSFYAKMHHSFCSPHIQNLGCEENSSNYTKTPAYIYFFAKVIKAVDIGERDFNWRNAGVLILVCISIGFMIIFGVMRMRWTPLVIAVVMLTTLLCTFALSMTVKGIKSGVLKFFVPTKNVIGRLQTWIYPIEQTIVSMGLGAGPLTTFWSISKVRSWTFLECFILNTVVFLNTMFVGIMFFGAAGAFVHDKNTTIEAFFKNNNYEEIQTHIIVTQLFDKMTSGLSQFTVFVFYLLIFTSCTFTLWEYVHIVLLYISTFEWVRRFKRGRTIAFVCFVFFLLGLIPISKIGFKFMMAIDKIFIGTSLIVIVCYEMICLIYIYGMRDLSDDIEFVLGVFPNYYFQICWYALPSLFVIFTICSLYLKSCELANRYDIVAMCMTIFLIIMPVLVIALYKSVVYIRMKNFRAAVWPREVPVVAQSEENTAFKTNKTT